MININCDAHTVSMKESDCVCSVCYKAHLAILSTKNNSSESPDTSDSQLKLSIEEWKLKMADENTVVTKAILL